MIVYLSVDLPYYSSTSQQTFLMLRAAPSASFQYEPMREMRPFGPRRSGRQYRAMNTVQHRQEPARSLTDRNDYALMCLTLLVTGENQRAPPWRPRSLYADTHMKHACMTRCLGKRRIGACLTRSLGTLQKWS